jgi:hypothetical protein
LLAKQPEQRPQSGALVAQAIRIVEQRRADTAAPAASPPAISTADGWPERSSGNAVLSAFVVAGIALVLLAFFLLLAGC